MEVKEIIVDGISGTRPTHIEHNYFFSLKEDEAEGIRLGTAFRWSARFKVSEKHWLKCGVLIPEHAYCSMCGEREL